MQMIILMALLYTCDNDYKCEKKVVECFNKQPWVMMHQIETTRAFNKCSEYGGVNNRAL